MDKFAFLFHPFDIDTLFGIDGIREQSIKDKDKRLVERSLRWLPPVKYSTEIITSATGKQVICEMIMVTLICDQILNMKSNFVLNKTIKAAQLAEKLGCKMVGLGAYLSPVGRRGVQVSEAVHLPVTSGTTYTIATAIDATLEAARQIGIDIKDARVTIIGATGSIGTACAHSLAKQVAQLTLAARNKVRLNILREEIISTGTAARIECSTDLKASVKNSDIVVISTNTPLEILSVQDFPAGCVVCDVSVPHNISSKDADASDVLIIDGGLVQVPGAVHFDYLVLPPGVAYACLSEVMILALEGMYENFSSGGDISYEKIVQIKQLAAKHGFKLAQFKSFGVVVSEQHLEKIRKARLKRS